MSRVPKKKKRKPAPGSPRAASVPTKTPGIRLPLIAAFALILGLIATALAVRGVGMPSATPVPVPAPDTSAMQIRVAQGIDAARREVDRKPTSPETWGRLGSVCDVHDLFDCAAESYRESMRLEPRNFRWPYFLAIVQEKRGMDPDVVLSLFDRAAQLDPQFAPLHVRVGDTRTRKGELEQARQAYASAIGLNPNLGAAHLGLGQVLIDLDDPRAALASLETAQRLGGPDRRLFAARARAHRLLNEAELAQEAVVRSRQAESVIALRDPLRASINALGVSSSHSYDRAKELMSQSRYAEALAQLKIVEEARPNFASLQHRMGIAYARTGEAEKAIVHLSRALTLKEDLVDARGMLGALLLEKGEFEGATEHFRRAMLDDTDNTALSVGLASALMRNGDPDAAVAELQRMGRHTDLDVNGEYLLCTLLFRRGDAEDAVPHCDAAVRLKPDHAAAHHQLARAYEALGQTASAEDHDRKAQTLRPGGT